MYPTRLNLLSGDKQNFLQKLVLAQYIKRVLEISVVVLCIGGIILLNGQNILDKHFNDLILNSISFSNQQATKNREILTINRSIADVQILQKQYTLWTPFLARLIPALPNGVVITAMEIDKKNKTATFTGLANSREDLLNLKTNFLALPEVSSIDIPLTQFAEKENIPLSFKVTFK